jgi:hypothetical protein
MDKIADVASGIVLVALVTTVVAHKNSAQVVSSIGGAFAGGIRAAMGK